MPAASDKVTTATVRARKVSGAVSGERIAVVTAYDVVFARLADEAGIDIVLVGDSLGMVVQGERNTLGVTLDDTIYHHAHRVARRAARAPGRGHAVHELPGLGRGRHARRRPLCSRRATPRR
jgi:3-methyl-2-oxobutanoate hydroxymethyltransferase